MGRGRAGSGLIGFMSQCGLSLKAPLVRAVEALRASYWFLPGIMAFSAGGLALVLAWVDSTFSVQQLGVPWFFEISADGAREILSSVAGSMITVAGVTFSMTILAISHASTQMGPRLLSNFMRDRGNQVTLGTFIAAFLYCLLVLRMVHGSSDDTGPDGSFVPYLSILGALLLTLMSVAVLIYFIHHVPETISVSNVVAQVGTELERKIRSLYLPLGEGAEAFAEREASSKRWERLQSVPGVPICVRNPSGYLQYCDEQGLVRLAKDRSWVIAIEIQSGSFLSEGIVLARVRPASRSTCVVDLNPDDPGREARPSLESVGSEEVDAEWAERIESAFACGPERTARQDILFLAHELVEIAIRALSPGVNDPFTALRCLDRIGAALAVFGDREPPSPFRMDEQGELRLITRPTTFEDFANGVLEPLRSHVKRDPMVATHLLNVLASVSCRIGPSEHRAVLMQHARALHDAAHAELNDPLDRCGLSRAFEAVTDA